MALYRFCFRFTAQSADCQVFTLCFYADENTAIGSLYGMAIDELTSRYDEMRLYENTRRFNRELCAVTDYSPDLLPFLAGEE